ncbi:GNAT family N-acetyltransferase [Bacillus spongiae]|uniref:GNAT family N-acetyltransferase n=1 Tax=Bacillus spongiae TaxID=2683610 RepID=A0ABU8HF04_9BACI
MEIVYETERLYLGVFDESHAEAMKTFWGNEDVMKFCDGATKHEKFPQIIKIYREIHQTNDLSVYAVQEKASSMIIGAAGFNITKSMEKIELIFHFSQSTWGKGFATEAVIACLNMARKDGRVSVITASADPRNLASLNILEKVGFQYKGTKWFDEIQQEEPYYEYHLL